MKDILPIILVLRLCARSNGTILFLQQCLIEKIIKAVGFDDSCNNMAITSLYPPIGKYLNVLSRQKYWHYASVIGMLNYLCWNNCSDIKFTAHQCACFTLVPKVSYEQAVSCVFHYIIAMKNKWCLVTPLSWFLHDCYVDSDFAGLYKTDDVTCRTSAISWTGFIFTFTSISILWIRKLQTEIALY